MDSDSRSRVNGDENLGELLQATVTLAGLVLVFLTLQEASQVPGMIVVATIGGFLALAASMMALIGLLDSDQPLKDLISLTNVLGMTFWALIFFGIAFIILAFSRYDPIVPIVQRFLRIRP